MKYGQDRKVKRYYSISEVAKLTGVEKHVLRYWENEFSQLNPKKNRAGNRTYTERDILVITEIEELLHQKKFTIEGAKLQFKNKTLHAELQDDVAELDQKQISIPSNTASLAIVEDEDDYQESMFDFISNSVSSASPGLSTDIEDVEAQSSEEESTSLRKEQLEEAIAQLRAVQELLKF